MSDKLNEIYDLCTSIRIAPHNASTRKEVIIDADLCVENKKYGRFHYSKINVSQPTLDEAIAALHYLVIGHKKLVEEMP